MWFLIIILSEGIDFYISMCYNLHKCVTEES